MLFFLWSAGRCALPVIQPPTNTGVRGGSIGSLRRALGEEVAEQVASYYDVAADSGSGKAPPQHVFWVEVPSDGSSGDEQVAAVTVRPLAEMSCRKLCRMQIKLRQVEEVVANVEMLIQRHQSEPDTTFSNFEKALQE